MKLKNFDYSKRIQLFKEMAELGYVVAYRKLGKYFMKGTDTLEKIDEAIAYFRKCIEHTDVFSEMELGDIWECLAECYRKKDNTELMVQAYVEAIRIYTDIANTKDDDGRAFFKIGIIYENGAKEIRNYSKAYQNYESALYRGNLGAARYVAACYEYGKGVERNTGKAFAVIDKYSQCGDYNYEDYYTLLKAVYFDYGIGTRKNSEEAIKIYQNLTDNEDIFISKYAKYCLAICYYHGQGIEKDIRKALQLFKDSKAECSKYYISVIETKSADDYFNLSVMYRVNKDFIFTKQHLERSFQFCKEAYEVSREDRYSFQLAEHYFKGIGTPRNYKKAFELFSECENDNDNAYQIIGEYFYYGCTQKRNYEEAIKRFDYGNRRRNNRARLFLGLCYLNGNGVRQDLDHALELFGQETIIEDFYSDYAQGIRTLIILSNHEFHEKYETGIENKVAELSERNQLWSLVFKNRDLCTFNPRMARIYLEVLIKRLEFPYHPQKPYCLILSGLSQMTFEIIRTSREYIQSEKGGLNLQELNEEISRLKEALLESKAENKYKEAVIQSKEQSILELSQQVQYYRDDLKSGLFEIEAKVDEVNARTKNVQDELRGLILFVKEDLVKYIQEQKRLLQLGMKDDIERSEIKISQACTEISKYINEHMVSDHEVDTNRETEYLISIFGKSWDKITEESKTSLISASVLWKLCVHIKGNFDYSGICISATTALESELKKYFFTGFQDYLEDKYGAPDENEWERTFDNWPEILLSTTQYWFKKNLQKYNQLLSECPKKDTSKVVKPVIERSSIFTLGKMPFLFGTRRDEHVSDKQTKLLCSRLNEYLDTFIEAPKGRTAIEVFTSKDYGKSFIEKCEQIRINYRNKAAHDDLLTEEQAKECYHEVIGKIESFEYTNEVTGILLQLFQYIK